MSPYNLLASSQKFLHISRKPHPNGFPGKKNYYYFTIILLLFYDWNQTGI